jgi:hypothetical protein
MLHCTFSRTVVAYVVVVVMPNALAEKKLNAERDLIAFVGKRLSVTPQTNIPPAAFDHKFEAHYRVVQLVFGRYDGPEITFTAFDHYGSPPFARYDTALMFVSRHEGKLYHEKYQFFPVYPTADGRWAGCGDPYRSEPPVHRGKLKPVPIKFTTIVRDGKTGKPCSHGNYVEDLLSVKTNGVLKARGWF